MGDPGFPPRSAACLEEEEEVLAAFLVREILAECRRLGMNEISASEVCSDIWKWLLRTGRTNRMLSRPYLLAVVRNFHARWQRRERTWAGKNLQLEAMEYAELPGTPDLLDSKIALDKIERGLPPSESAVIGLLRQGVPWSDALEGIGVPPGSHSRWKNRILRHARSAGAIGAPARRGLSTQVEPGRRLIRPDR